MKEKHDHHCPWTCSSTRETKGNHPLRAREIFFKQQGREQQSFTIHARQYLSVLTRPFPQHPGLVVKRFGGLSPFQIRIHRDRQHEQYLCRPLNMYKRKEEQETTSLFQDRQVIVFRFVKWQQKEFVSRTKHHQHESGRSRNGCTWLSIRMKLSIRPMTPIK